MKVTDEQTMIAILWQVTLTSISHCRLSTEKAPLHLQLSSWQHIGVRYYSDSII